MCIFFDGVPKLLRIPADEYTFMEPRSWRYSLVCVLHASSAKCVHPVMCQLVVVRRPAGHACRIHRELSLAAVELQVDQSWIHAQICYSSNKSHYRQHNAAKHALEVVCQPAAFLTCLAESKEAKGEHLDF